MNKHLKYRALILDHDDTVVRSTSTIHYPCFQAFTSKYFPDFACTLEEFFLWNFDPGVTRFFREIVGMDDEMLRIEQEYWSGYVQGKIPAAYDGIREILETQRAAGGLLTVVSHSFTENILRDYRANGLPEPDYILGWEQPPHQRKPNPWPVQQILSRYGLSPEEVLVLDDLKPGLDMARAAGVPFAAAGWANDIPEIEMAMRQGADYYFSAVKELREFLFGREA